MDLLRNATHNTSHALSNNSHHPPMPSTALFGYLHLGLAVISLISSPFILFVYARSPQLWTPFSIYIASLATLELANSCTNRLTLISSLLQIPWVLGNGYCLFALFCTTVFTGSIIHVQALISTNRLWAVTFPNNYRVHHSKKVAVCCVVAVVAYMSAWTIPGFIITDPRNRQTPKFCMYSFSDKSLYFMFTGIFTHFLPQLYIMLLYPFIYWKVRVAMRRKTGVTAKSVPQASNGTKETAFSTNTNAKQSSTALELSQVKKEKKPVVNTGKRHFSVLTALLISFVILWTPVHVAYILTIGTGYTNVRLMAVGSLLSTLDCLLNPIICLLVSKEWRQAARNKLTNACCKTRPAVV